MKSDIRVLNVETDFITIARRVSFVYAKGKMSENLVANVRATVVNRAGDEATGCGSIHLAGPWAFPSKAVPTPAKRETMRQTVERLAGTVQGFGDYAHPLDYYWALRGEILKAAQHASAEMGLAEPLPRLAAYVSYGAIDMALLDAFGKANGISAYAGLGKEHCARDLGHYLGPRFTGRWLSDFLSVEPKAAVPFAHTVGEADPLTRADLDGSEPHDGLPVALEGWIRRDRVRFLKVKADGSCVDAAIGRTAAVFELAEAIAPGRTKLSIDFNEACDTADWVVEYLRKLQEQSPAAFDALGYVEQPFGRDADVCAEDVARVQAFKPLVADESMTDCDSVRRVLDRGWRGIALKVAKVMTSSFLHVAAALDAGRLLTVQDLCNSGLAHVASVGLAARIPLFGGAECNGRQFVPQAFPEIQAAHRPTFVFADGTCRASSTMGLGLGF